MIFEFEFLDWARRDAFGGNQVRAVRDPLAARPRRVVFRRRFVIYLVQARTILKQLVVALNAAS